MKKLLFAAILILAPVLLMVGMAEWLLRVGGFGYSTTPLLRHEQDGTAYWIGNPDFTRLFFPAALKRLPPANRVPVDKPQGTRRYLVVGGSAAAGDPDTDFSIARNLDWILHQLHPDKSWEVLNLAYTACNSHVAAEVVRQSAAYDPDGILVLVGNNEVIGPYGPGTSLTDKLPSSARRRLEIALRKSKLGQLGQALREKLRSSNGASAQWRGMRHFLQHRIRKDDPRLKEVYSNFRDNLATIKAEARRRNIPVLLSTVPVNLLDQPPFLGDWDQLPAELRQDLLPVLKGEKNDPERTRTAVAALESYPDSATVAYAAGRLLWLLGDREQGRPLLRRARDLDQLRFRADSRINALIREAWTGDSATCLPVDPTESLRTDNPHHALGFPHFYEHVHFSFRANFLIARAMARPLLEEAGLSTEGVDQLQWNDAANGLAYTSFEAWRILGEIEKRFTEAPFTAIPGYRELTSWMDQLRDALQQRIAMAEEKARLQQIYQNALRARPGDDRIRLNYAQFLAAFDRGEAALALLENQLTAHPTDNDLAVTVFNLSHQLRQTDQAAAALRRVEAIFPEHPGLPQMRKKLAELPAP